MGYDNPAKILVIDDNPDNVYIIERALSNVGFAVDSALSGEHGLARARRGDLDLVVLDVMMPGMDGFQVLQALRADELTHDLPVIMITAAFDPRFTVRGMELGANEYLTRPVHPIELVARVRSLLRTREIERQREEFQHALEEQRNLLQSIINSMGEAVFVSNVQGQLQTINHVGADLTGLDPTSVLGISVAEVLGLLTPEGRLLRPGELPMERARRGEETRGVETVVVNQRTGGETPVQLSCSPVRDRAGQMVAIVTVASDVSRLKSAESQIRELAMENARRAQVVAEINGRLADLAARLQAVIDEMPEGVIVADIAADRLTSINRVARTLLGVEDSEQIRLSDLPTASHIRSSSGKPLGLSDLPIWRALYLRETVVEDVQIALPGRPPVQVLMSAAPIIEQTDETVAVLRDVTEMRELDRLKDDFFFVAAHEIKNPLTAIKGFAQMLNRRAQRVGLTAEIQTSLQTIDRQCDRLTRLIDRLMDVSRIQLGRFHLEPRPMGLTALVQRVVEDYQATASDHPIILALPDGESIGVWDEMRLEQVLTNLLSNAVKYSPEGREVQVSVDLDPEHALISVRDCGIGIPADKLPRIFERFYRTPAASESRIEGLGLGLFVAREIVVAHGGDIWVDSVPGQGSTFHVKLPLAAPDSEPGAEASRSTQ
ncbi:MAG: response regulator [Chloroflexota bacterium]|nr:MAG: response regulator [Chloroflexota bacterium]